MAHNKPKYTNISPIVENNTYASNFQQKAHIFNNDSAGQCKIIDIDILPEVFYKTFASMLILLI